MTTAQHESEYAAVLSALDKLMPSEAVVAARDAVVKARAANTARQRRVVHEYADLRSKAQALVSAIRGTPKAEPTATLPAETAPAPHLAAEAAQQDAWLAQIRKAGVQFVPPHSGNAPKPSLLSWGSSYRDVLLFILRGSMASPLPLATLMHYASADTPAEPAAISASLLDRGIIAKGASERDALLATLTLLIEEGHAVEEGGSIRISDQSLHAAVQQRAAVLQQYAEAMAAQKQNGEAHPAPAIVAEAPPSE